jgi:DNA-binding transcriptional LysR family regulator
MTLGSTQAVVAAVGQNLGVGFVSNNAVVNRGNKVVAVRIDGLSLERDLSLVYETGRVRRRQTQAFIDFAKTKSS